jgi:hypothetical protein
MVCEDLIFSATLFLLILLALIETHASLRSRRGRGGMRPV